jgi:hypothetical protein
MNITTQLNKIIIVFMTNSNIRAAVESLQFVHVAAAQPTMEDYLWVMECHQSSIQSSIKQWIWMKASIANIKRFCYSMQV